jgi:hypothetical protein
MWKFKDGYNGETKDEIIAHAESVLMALRPIIPEIRSMRFERDVLRSERSFDVLYLVEFDSLEALESYRVHPEHQKVVAYISQVHEAQAVTDTEI